MRELMCYLKTTDTCNLNCAHCFTNGINGKKGWFDVPATIDFFQRLKKFNPELDNGNISFHGGEPLIAPTELLFETWHGVKDLWENVWWSVQTNLTFSLNSGRLDVLEKICDKSWGTSWDKNIRWSNQKQEDLWEDNVKQLVKDGHNITVMVSVSKSIVEMEPIDIINYISSLGIKHINFERITGNGNALLNSGIIPLNIELDAWFHKMWKQSIEHKTYEYIDNMFFDSILTEVVHSTHAGCRCRMCEQKILTINADGTIGGCPNGAVDKQFAHINDHMYDILFSPQRLCNIQSELMRPKACYECPVYDTCNGDCHQLEFQGDICPAPKSMMIDMNENRDIDLFKKFLNGFVGQE